MNEYFSEINQVLLNQDFKVSLGKTALVGFPKLATGVRTVYILAVCVRQQGS